VDARGNSSSPHYLKDLSAYPPSFFLTPDPPLRARILGLTEQEVLSRIAFPADN
jgi:hypothetical protein